MSFVLRVLKMCKTSVMRRTRKRILKEWRMIRFLEIWKNDVEVMSDGLRCGGWVREGRVRSIYCRGLDRSQRIGLGVSVRLPERSPHYVSLASTNITLGGIATKEASQRKRGKKYKGPQNSPEKRRENHTRLNRTTITIPITTSEIRLSHHDCQRNEAREPKQGGHGIDG